MPKEIMSTTPGRQIFDQLIQQPSTNRCSSSSAGNYVPCFPFLVVWKLFLMSNLNVSCQRLSVLLLVLLSLDVKNSSFLLSFLQVLLKTVIMSSLGLFFFRLNNPNSCKVPASIIFPKALITSLYLPWKLSNAKAFCVKIR